MDIEYACNFELVIDRTQPSDWSKFEVSLQQFVSSESELENWIDFTYDFPADENESIKNLPDGTYLGYARGVAWYEPEVDWESGIDEGGWHLGIDVIRVAEAKDEQS
jgi:hypothetical protein